MTFLPTLLSLPPGGGICGIRCRRGWSALRATTRPTLPDGRGFARNYPSRRFLRVSVVNGPFPSIVVDNRTLLK
jgi:hypothetical protein